jgi:hypothetical protein
MVRLARGGFSAGARDAEHLRLLRQISPDEQMDRPARRATVRSVCSGPSPPDHKGYAAADLALAVRDVAEFCAVCFGLDDALARASRSPIPTARRPKPRPV